MSPAYRAELIAQTLSWLAMARDLSKEVDNWRGGQIVNRIDNAVERLHRALDIKPSEDAIAAVIGELATSEVCKDCGGKGATAPNGVQFCNCDDVEKAA